MKIAGERRLEHRRERVWAALMDPEVLARTLPGCRALERDTSGEGDDAFTGRLEVSVGPVRGEFRGRLEMSELEPPESYRMRLDGRGPSGFLSGKGTVRLEEVGGDEGGAATLLRYDLDAQVGGRLAGLGQRLLESSGKAVAAQGLDGLERQLAGTDDSAAPSPEPGPEPGPEAAVPALAAAATPAAAELAAPATPSTSRSAAPPPPSQAAFAAGVAREMVKDLVPPEARPLAWAGAGFLAGLLLGFWMGGRRRGARLATRRGDRLGRRAR